MKAKRIFNGQDLDMFKNIFDSCTHFEKYLTDFTAFDPGLDAAFLNNWKAIQEQVLKFYPDKLEVIQGEILLDESITALQKCQTKYIEVKYFVVKAFPKNAEALKEFGEGKYSKVRNSPLRMVQFMETLYGVAMKYKTELIAKGYTQAAIDEIAALANELREDNKKQQLKKQERPTQTRSRIELLNTYYGFGQQVAMVAPTVFATSPAKRKLFLLAPSHRAKIIKTYFELDANGLRKILWSTVLKKYKLRLTNQSNEPVEYWQANTAKEKPAQKYLLNAGEIISVEAEEPLKKFLVIENTTSGKVKMLLRKEKIAKKEE